MKTKNIKLAVTLLILFGCQQEVITLEDPIITPPVTSGTKGNADFTKFVAIGNSFVAGVQAGALFTESQNNSLPAIMAKQFASTGVGGGTFNQAAIKASLGYNLFVSPNPDPSDNRIQGRLLLQTSTTIDCPTNTFLPKPTAQKYALGNLEAAPTPANPNFLANGLKPTLNNFGVPAIVLGQALIPQTGAWSGAGIDPRFSPFYGRLAYPGTGTSTILGDVAAAGGSFFLFYLGLDDFFLYAAFGGDPTKAPLTVPVGGTPANFDYQYAGAIQTLLATNPNLKGVVGNFPDIFVMPHFTSITYNPIPLDAAKVSAVNAGFATGYNQVLDGLIASSATSAALKAELATRKVTYAATCTNKILIKDETLTDLTPYFDALGLPPATRAGLTPYVQVRQTTTTDIIPLSAGTLIGTTVGGNPSMIQGVTVPLNDAAVLIPTEIAAIRAARDAYNTIIANVAAANSTRIALADVSAGFAALVAARVAVSDGVTISPGIAPPTGIYSEDGVHPNSRGYAFMANIFIDAINAKFGATVPKASLAAYTGTALPIQ